MAKINPKDLMKTIQKNVRYAMTGEEDQEDILAAAAAKLAKLDSKSREALLRAQPEVIALEGALAVTSADASKLNDDMLAAISGAGWLMNIMGNVGIENLSELLTAQLPKLDGDVERQARRLRTARIRAAAAHNADMLLKIAPEQLTGMILDEKDQREELKRAEAIVKAAKGKPNKSGK